MTRHKPIEDPLVRFIREVTQFQEGTYLEIQRHVGDKFYQHFFTSVQKAADYVTGHNRGDIYFGVCPRSRRRGMARDSAFVPCLWVDVDHRLPPGLFTRGISVPLPSLIVNTSPWPNERAHVYWLLKRRWRPSRRIREILQGLRLLLEADTTQDFSRRLRLPYTQNTKHTYEDKAHYIVQAHGKYERYKLAEFDHLRERVGLENPEFEIGLPKEVDVEGLGLNDRTLSMITEGLENPWTQDEEAYQREDGTVDRSRFDMSIVRNLKSEGCTPEQIRWVLENFPCSGRVEAIKHKESYVKHTIRAAWKSI